MRLLPAVFALLVLAGAPCMAQSVAPPDTSHDRAGGTVSRLFLEGVRRAKTGAYSESLARLRPLLEEPTLSLSARQRSVLAYWVGKAHAEQGRTGRALDVWRAEISEEADGRAEFSYRLADAFIRIAARQGTAADYEKATRAYLRLLQRLDEGALTSGEKTIARRHLRELAVVLPPKTQERTGVRFDRDDFQVTVDRTPDAGTVLAGWWRRQDPIPRTRQNERIREHLQRVSYARTHFTHEGRMDDRGRLYIRFGEPYRSQSIGMEKQETVSPISSRLRRNEFWTYPTVGPKAYYLLVEKDPETFTVGGVTDLFPTDLMPGREYLYLMEKVLRELATFHGDYGTRAAEVFGRAAWSRDNEQYGIGSDPYDGPPEDFVRKMEDRIENIDEQNAERRAERVPYSYSDVAQKRPDLPIASRTARFLTETGKTTVQIYWSLPRSALALTDALRQRLEGSYTGPDPSSSEQPGHFGLAVSTRLENQNHIDERTRTRRYLVSPSSKNGSILKPRTVSMTVDDSLFHVAAQWDQTVVPENGRKKEQMGRALRRHTERYDTLSVLRSDPRTLEMSDPKLLTVPNGTPATAVTSESAIPYPFPQVQVGEPLAIAFEVYHLGLSDDDRTRYAVSYKMARRTEDDGMLFGLFGGDGDGETTTTTIHEGKSRTEKEYILLGLENVVDDESSAVDVTVRVKDKVTGQAVSRSIGFRAVAPEDT